MALTEQVQQAYRARLTEERGRTETDLANLGAEIVVLGDDDGSGRVGNHIADDATDVMEQERNLALIGNLEERLRDIDHALGRLDSGEYGNCERCGRPIGAERLDALPFVHLCIDCQEIEDLQRRPAMV